MAERLTRKHLPFYVEAIPPALAKRRSLEDQAWIESGREHPVFLSMRKENKLGGLCETASEAEAEAQRVEQAGYQAVIHYRPRFRMRSLKSV